MEGHQFPEETSDIQYSDFIAGEDRGLESIQHKIDECEKDLMDPISLCTTSDNYSEVFQKKRVLITRISEHSRQINK